MKSDFNKRIKEIANSYSETPSSGAWDKIVKRLPKNRRKIGSISVLSIAAIVMILFVSLFVTLSYLPNSDKDIRYIKNLKNLDSDQESYAIMVQQLNEAYSLYPQINEGFEREIRVK